MKIAHVGPSALPILFARGGATERRVAEMARVQAANGHEVLVYSAEEADGESQRYGFRLRGFKCGRNERLRHFEFLYKAGRHLRREGVDVIHFHGTLEGIWFVRNLPARKVLSYDYFRNRRWLHFPTYNLYRWTMQQYDRLLPVSQFCMEESTKFWKIPNDRMLVLHNGVNMEQFAPDDAAAEAMIRRRGLRDAPIVLYVGRVCEQKGTDLLLDAYTLVKERRPELQLVVAGPAEKFGNEAKSPLVRRIEEVGGHYLGAVPEADLAATYNMGSVYVMATRRDEMFGMAAAEAQACGKAVICSDNGGLPEVISPRSGLQFPVGDASALSAALERVFTEPGLLPRLSGAARENAQRFSWESIVNQAQRIYETS